MQQFRIEEGSQWAPQLSSEFRKDYCLGQYSTDQITNVMWKYLNRHSNTKRAWQRINQHLPETLVIPEPLDILEFSTAHGAMLDIWRKGGHRVRGTDFNWATEDSYRQHKGIKKAWHQRALADLTKHEHPHPVAPTVHGWPYQPIIESLGLDVDLFDGGQWPYPYADKSFDVVCCYQAIEAYAEPQHWMDILDEFCRIARRTVVVGFNPLPVRFADDDQMQEAARQAWLQMQNYNRNGFITTFFEIGKTRRGIHPTAVKLVRHG